MRIIQGMIGAGLTGLFLVSAVRADTSSRTTGLRWSGSIPLQTFYDSNIYRSSRSPIEGPGLRVNPSLSFGYERPAWSLGANTSWMRERYFGLLDKTVIQDRQGVDSAASGSLRFTSGLAFASSYKYVDTEEPVYAELEQDRTPVRRFRNFATGRIGQKLGAGRLNASLDYKFISDRYAAKVNRILDSDLHSFILKAVLKAFPKTAFFGRMIADVRTYRLSSSLVSDNYKDFGLNAGMVGEWSPRLKGTVMLGGEVFMFERSGVQWTPIIKLDLTYQPSGLSKVIVGYEHVLLDSTSTDYFNVDRLRLRLEKKLSRSWNFYIDTSGSLLRYSPPFPRTDLALQNATGFSVSPVPIPQLEIDLHYGYDYRDSTVQTYRYISQTVGLDISWKL